MILTDLTYVISRTSFFSALVTIFLLIGIGAPVSAQEQITILRAESAEGGFVDGEPVRKLLGDVRLQTQDMTMDADSAYQFENRNFIQAFNIQIESEQDIVWADTLTHHTDTGFSEFRGRVIVLTETYVLFSETVDYDRVLEVALFQEPVRFEDEDGTLIAEDGYYFQGSDTGFFRGNVQLSDSTQYLEADSLFMNRRNDFYRLFSDVHAEDYEEKVTFSGEYLEADSTGHRLLEENAWMMQVNESDTDTTHLLAGSIEVIETDTSDFINAYENVRIWSPSFAAISDTARYRSDHEIFRLISNPIAWHQNIQLTGPYIEAHLEEEELQYLISYIQPIAVQQDSLTDRLNQIKGDTLEAFFEDGEIDRIVTFDNSELIFHLKDEGDEPDGLIELIAAGASIINFSEGELDQFRAEQNIEGSHLPEDPVNIERQLPGFRWDPDRRPRQPEIRYPRLPPIPNERPFELPERYIRYLSVIEDAMDDTSTEDAVDQEEDPPL